MSTQTTFQPAQDTPVSILVALYDLHELCTLGMVLTRSNWRIHMVRGPEKAVALLRTGAVGVAVVPYRAPGCFSWRDLLEETRRIAPPPRVVVTDRVADESMWAEVLNLGGYDLLAQPFQPQEVFHVLTRAWRSWREDTAVSSTGSGLHVLKGHAA